MLLEFHNPEDSTLEEKLARNMETYHLCHSPPPSVVTLQELHPSLPEQTNPQYQESWCYCYVTAGAVHKDALEAVFQSYFLPHSETGVTND